MMRLETPQQFDAAMAMCRDVFFKKFKDYGTSWRIMRTRSVTDQIFIKAQRIRSLEDNGETKVGEGVVSEFVGIVNYGIIGLIQLELRAETCIELDEARMEMLFDKYSKAARDLMVKKNFDYGEAWRSMRVSSYTDLILMKIYRTKQIEDNEGKTLISEGVDANYFDMINYSVFALIRLEVEKES